MSMLKKQSPPFIAFLQITGLVVYLLMIATFFNFVLPTFANKEDPFYAPVIMLLLFVLSAVISASLVLGRAAVYFWEKQYKACFTLLYWTLGWGFAYFFAFILHMYFTGL